MTERLTSASEGRCSSSGAVAYATRRRPTQLLEALPRAHPSRHKTEWMTCRSAKTRERSGPG
jgi:hypothetical protein